MTDAEKACRKLGIEPVKHFCKRSFCDRYSQDINPLNHEIRHHLPCKNCKHKIPYYPTGSALTEAIEARLIDMELGSLEARYWWKGNWHWRFEIISKGQEHCLSWGVGKDKITARIAAVNAMKEKAKREHDCGKCAHQKTYKVCGQFHQASRYQQGRCPVNKYKETPDEERQNP